MAAASMEWQAPMSAGPRGRPLWAWSAARLQPLCDRLAQASREWSLAWGLAPATSGFRARAAGPGDLDRATWVPLARPGGVVHGWLAAPGGEAVQRLLWGRTTGGGRIAPALAERCATDAAGRVAASLGLQATPLATARPDAGTVGRWSGSVLLEQGGHEHAFAILLEAEAVEAGSAGPTGLVRPRPALAGLSEAMRDRQLTFQVRLDGCSLDLGALSGLRLGDVVRLEHGLDEPVTVTDQQGASCFAGHLAQRGTRKALVLARCDGGGRHGE